MTSPRALPFAAAIAAALMAGCANQPRLGTTFPLHTKLTVDEALWAEEHLPWLEADIVEEIGTLDPAETYRRAVLEERLDTEIPYHVLAESMQVHISKVELRHTLPEPDAWIWVTVSVRRVGEEPRPPEEDPQVKAWHAFVDRFQPDLAWSQRILASVMSGGPAFSATIASRGADKTK